ncbi:MAG: hypothetical protein WC759_04365 [Candidatus Micrarchaeia archaeon]|jgi:hypothetical protein
MARANLIVFLMLSLILFAGCASQSQPAPEVQQPPATAPIKTYACPTGEVVEKLTDCPVQKTEAEPAAPVPAAPNTTAPLGPAVPPEPPAKETVSEPTCGDGLCNGMEAFSTCQQDCNADFSYIYEYADGLQYSYLLCDYIGKDKTCAAESDFVGLGQPYREFNKLIPLYSPTNSFSISRKIDGRDWRLNDTNGNYTIWVNLTSSECLRYIQLAKTSYGGEVVLECRKSTAIKYLGIDYVTVPIGSFSAQKFEISYSDGGKMYVWKDTGSIGSTGVTNGLRVPVKTEETWSYLSQGGLTITLKTVKELRSYIGTS